MIHLVPRMAVGLLFVFAGIREIAQALRAKPKEECQTANLLRQFLSSKRLKLIRCLIGVGLIVGGSHAILIGW
jgi:uncharacterized membrane protein HdeD (DUF308 family)